jgi:phage protein D
MDLEARRCDIRVVYAGTDISLDLKPYLKGFTYRDPASGQADTLSLAIADHEGKWIGAWFPEKTDSITAAIAVQNWNGDGDDREFDCGLFMVDNVSFGGPPTELTLEAISTPAAGSWNCRKNTKTWEKTTLYEIAGKLAAEAGVRLVYEAGEVPIDILEQSEETDMTFLENLCKDYGLAMKAYSNRLIVFDEERYEARASVTTLTREDILTWSGNTTLTGVADGATVKYTDPQSGQDLTYEYSAPNPGGRRTHKLHESNEKADNLADAQRKAKALVRAANREETTMSLTLEAKRWLTATSCVDIVGFGYFDGKYFISQVEHQVSGGYGMTLEVRRVA